MGHQTQLLVLPLALCCDSRIPPGTFQAPTGCSHSCPARLHSPPVLHCAGISAGALALLAQAARGVFNPSIQSVWRDRRRSIRHMLTSAPRRGGRVSQGILVLLSSHSHVQKVCSGCLGVTPGAGELHEQVLSFPPLCSQQGHGQGFFGQGTWTRVLQGRRIGGGTPSSPGFPSVGSAPQKAQVLPSRSQCGFWDMGVWRFVGLRTHVLPKQISGELWMQLWPQSTRAPCSSRAEGAG